MLDSKDQGPRQRMVRCSRSNALSTLDTVNNLAILYKEQGKMEEAEEMYLRALRGKEEAWGAKHRSILDTVYNLGNLYFKEGRSTEVIMKLTSAIYEGSFRFSERIAALYAHQAVSNIIMNLLSRPGIRKLTMPVALHSTVKLMRR